MPISFIIFFKLYPKAIIEIEAVDKKRLRFYNTIFKRRFSEIQESFILRGVNNEEIEIYVAGTDYQKFELELKK